MASTNKKCTLISYACLVCLCLAILNFIAEVGIGLYMKSKFEQTDLLFITKHDFHENFLSEIRTWRRLTQENVHRQKRDDSLDIENICKDIDVYCPRLQGPEGMPAQKGESGTPGFRGEPGLRGIEGLPGHMGEKGDTGEKGEKGSHDTCIPGIKGNPGRIGPRGLPGVRCKCEN